MGFLSSYAAIGWSSTSDTAPTRVVMLGVPLRQTHPAFSQATYRAQSLDRTTIESLTVPSGAHELVGEIRYQQDSQGLLDMLVAGNANTTLTYYPDVRDPGQSYTCKLIEPTGEQIETAMDPQRNTFGDTSVAIRLRRTDQLAFTEQYVGTNLLFWYKGGGSLQSGTFTRATTATEVGIGGTYAAVASDKAATMWVDTDADGVRDLPGLGLWQSRTNLVLQSENFGTTWTTAGTPTRSVAAATCGTVSLDLIGDDTGGAKEGYVQPVTFTGNAVKAVSAFWKAPTSAAAGGAEILLWDNTAGASRMDAVVTATSAGAPSVAMSAGTYLGAERLAGGIYRLHFQSSSVTAANTNRIEVYPAAVSGQQGNVYLGGVQCENAPVPGPYIPTTTGTVTRNADTLSFACNGGPQTLTVYVRLVSNGVGFGPDLLWIGDASVTAPFLAIRDNGTTDGRLFARYSNGVSTSTSAMAGTTTIGDVLEFRVTLTASGVVTLASTKNGAAEVVETAGSAVPLAPSWSANTVRLSGPNAVILNLAILRGVQSLDTMRRVAKVV